MAFKKALAQRLLNMTKVSSQTFTKCRISSSSVQGRIPQSATTPDIAPEPGENVTFRRFLHERADFQTTFSPKLGENLVHKLKEMDIARNRIRLDGLSPPAMSDSTVAVTADDARKLLKVAQLELVKSKLRTIRNSCIPYTEFLRICQENCSNPDQAKRMAKMLDDSAAVVILGDNVFLRPEQVNTYFPVSFFFFFQYFSLMVNSVPYFLSLWLVLLGFLQSVMVEIKLRFHFHSIYRIQYTFFSLFFWIEPKLIRFYGYFFCFFHRKLKRNFVVSPDLKRVKGSTFEMVN